MDEAISFRNEIETRVNGMDDRLKRIELIIDKLQMSVLEKVGEYVIDVSDIKKELVEMQKSFGALVPEMKKLNKPVYEVIIKKPETGSL